MAGRARAFGRIVLCLTALALPAQAEPVFQTSTISSLAAGQYDGALTMTELLRQGDFGLGTFNGVDGEMIVLDGAVYRAIPGGRANLVAGAVRTPFAVVTRFRARPGTAVAAGLSLDALQAWLDSLPTNPAMVLAVRIDARFAALRLRSEPAQTPPYAKLAEVIRTQQVVTDVTDISGTLVGFRFPASAGSVNVAGWHFHFISADRRTGGHVLGLTSAGGRAALQQSAELVIHLTGTESGRASQDEINAIERPR